jgi:hypothetical protein
VDERFTHVNQPFDTFLNILGVRLESRSKLSSHFINEVVMSHVLSVFHDANDARLRNDERQSLGNMRLQYESYLDLVLSFLIDTIASLFPLLGSFHLGRHRTYLDLLHRT